MFLVYLYENVLFANEKKIRKIHEAVTKLQGSNPAFEVSQFCQYFFAIQLVERRSESGVDCTAHGENKYLTELNKFHKDYHMVRTNMKALLGRWLKRNRKSHE